MIILYKALLSCNKNQSSLFDYEIKHGSAGGNHICYHIDQSLLSSLSLLS